MGRLSTTPAKWAALLFGVCLAGGCAPHNGEPQAPRSVQRTQDTPSVASAGGELFSFPESTESPLEALQPVAAGLQPFLERCKQGDAALARVAERFARRQSEGSAPLDVAEISFALRAEGSPYVWPRAWTLEGGDLEGGAAVERMRAWLLSFGDGGERRCGVARVDGHGRSVLAAVAVDVLADLEPVPVRVRSGTWIDVDARLLVPSTDAKVIVLGPSGPPRAIPTSLDGSHARARFRADRSGAFLLQVLADVAGGPRPVLEASVYADLNPPSAYAGEVAPGEPVESAELAQTDSLLAMLNGARSAEQVGTLARDAALDGVAQAHAEAMRALKRIAHEAGDGDPRSRVEAAVPEVLSAGENVAHALDARRAHRALWASPSHRENMLEPRFDRVGIGTARDPDGSLWVCEVFADFPN